MVPGFFRICWRENAVPVPDREEFRRLAEKGNLIPVYEELLADLETPVSVLGKLGTEENTFLLESVADGEHLGRHSFIGHNPFFVLRARGDRVWLEHGEHSSQRGLREDESPLDVVRELLSGYQPVHVEGLPRFTGGAVGYVGYDTVRFFERLPDAPNDDLGLPDVLLLGTDELVIFDHVTHTMKVVVNAHVDGDPDAAYDRAAERIRDTVERLQRPPEGEDIQGPRTWYGREIRPELREGTSSNFERADFEAAVDACKEYIAAGDIIQVVLSQRFSRRAGAPPFEIYRALRIVNPSPYMFYLAIGGLYVVGSSPEILVTYDNGEAVVRPIAGTRPRGKTRPEDLALEQELLSDEKERAEHIMLVDLGRNDLGRVCEFGSVEVDELMVVERYSHVMHIVSNVRGRVREDMDQYDVLAATFPAGTVSGAPKIRAMEIIDELEPTRRGVYAGAVGYFGFSGNMDTGIAIRTIVIDRGVAHVQAGAGIVADSVPSKEYEETLNKAAALFAAIDRAGEQQ
ncbi:MAG: anthranilate synthase component I [Armatimonadia bacterium]|nr:anthranilate synthase component I [Armatimonadia bacterium]